MSIADLRPVPAHVVVPGSGATIALWCAMALMIGGGTALIVAHQRWLRGSGLVLAAVGVVTTVVASVFGSAAPASPAYSMTVARPVPGARVTSPLRVQVCGHLPGGAMADVPGPGRVVAVFVDGREVQTATSATLYVTTSAGPHTVRVEVLTADHQEFQPPVTTDFAVVVTGAGPLTDVAGC